MLEPEPPIESPPRPKPVRVWLYLVIGALIGIVAGIVAAHFASAMRMKTGKMIGGNYWQFFGMFSREFVGYWWFIGLLGGLIISKLVQRTRLRRWQNRKSRGLCVVCGYDLRGAASSRCPECGSPAYRETTTSSPPPQ
jgi:hypothetical protein